MLPFRKSGTPSATSSAVLYFFRRGASTLSCETRLNPDGHGFQLVIVENGDSRVEDYAELPTLLAREHQLLHAWRLRGGVMSDGDSGREPTHGPGRDDAASMFTRIRLCAVGLRAVSEKTSVRPSTDRRAA